MAESWPKHATETGDKLRVPKSSNTIYKKKKLPVIPVHFHAVPSYYGLQLIHCRRLSKTQHVLLPHMVSNQGLLVPDCHFSDFQDLLARAATTAFTTALAMSLHLGVRLAAPKHYRVYFNSKVLQLHIPTDTASTAINPPIPSYFPQKKFKIQSK